MQIYFSILFPLAVTAFFTLLFRPLAMRIGLVDVPNERKLHNGNIPLVGGIAVFCGFLFSVLALDMPVASWKPLFSAAALLLIVGTLDDFKEINIRERFLAQIGAVLLIALWGGIRVDSLGDLLGFGVIEMGLFSLPFTVFGAVGAMNAFNMIDGMDGLAGGLLLLLLGILASLLWHDGHAVDLHLVLIVCSCVLAFLLFNFRFSNQGKAFVFLGNSGSMFLGILVTYLLIKYSREPYGLFRPVTALWLFAIPLMDAVSIIIRRIAEGGSPFDSDRKHLHHVLQDSGLSIRRSAVFIFLLQLSCSSIGLGGVYYGVPDSLMFYGFMMLFGVYYLAVPRVWRMLRLVRLIGNQGIAVAK